jgi:hypothetical protein
METFFQNLVYLEPCAKVMKGLLKPLGKKTIRESLMLNFQPVAHPVVEEAEDKFSPLQGELSLDTAYKQLWLYGMRNFPEMVRATPRKEPGQPSPLSIEPSHWFWYKFASLARRVGFETEESRTILKVDPDIALARQVLLNCRPSCSFRFDQTKRNSFKNQMADMFGSAER